MKKQTPKRPSRAPRARLTLAKQIAAEPDYENRLDLAEFGQKKTPEAHMILNWWFVGHCMKDAKGKVVRTVQEVLAEDKAAWFERTAKMFASAIMARDSEFFHRFAEELQTWKRIAKARDDNGPVDPARTYLLLFETLRPRDRQTGKKMPRPSDKEIARMVARRLLRLDPRLPRVSNDAAVKTRAESIAQNICRIRKGLHLKKCPAAQAAKG